MTHGGKERKVTGNHVVCRSVRLGGLMREELKTVTQRWEDRSPAAFVFPSMIIPCMSLAASVCSYPMTTRPDVGDSVEASDFLFSVGFHPVRQVEPPI